MEILLAFILGPILLPLAIVTGNLQPLCEQGLEGTYTPSDPHLEQCPNGKWSNIIRTPK